MKKIILILITITMISTCIVPSYNNAFADGYDEYSQEMLDIALKILIDIGWWKEFDTSSSYLTRAETAALVCMWYNKYEYYKELKPHSKQYDDVSVDHWAAMFIREVRNRPDINFPAMSGDGDGVFRPDEYITYQEYTKTLVTVLGWQPYVMNVYWQNSYPTGYFKTADLLGIYPLRNDIADQPIEKNDAIIMLYNALKAPTWVKFGFSLSYYVKYDSFLEFNSRFGVSSGNENEAIYQIRGYATKFDDESFEIDGEFYFGEFSNKNFTAGNVLCLYKKYAGDETRYSVACYPISTLDFDNPKQISDMLPEDSDAIPKS